MVVPLEERETPFLLVLPRCGCPHARQTRNQGCAADGAKLEAGLEQVPPGAIKPLAEFGKTIDLFKLRHEEPLLFYLPLSPKLSNATHNCWSYAT
jgi:hypothetical protein